MLGLDQTAKVYTADPEDGEYTVLAKSGLACRLVRMTGTVAPAAERPELAGQRTLLWLPEYQMPDTAQVEIDGRRWNIQAGTIDYPRGPVSQKMYGRAGVVEATS